MRKLALTILLAIGASLVPTAATAAGTTYATYNCKATKKEPASILIACGDGSYYANHLHWSSWGTTTAKGRGVFHFNDCNPNCAAGTFHSRAGTLVLRARLWCPKIKRYVFSKGAATYDRPWHGKKSYLAYLSCPY